MDTTKKPRYLIRVIGEKEPLYFSNFRTAQDCLMRYREMGKTALLMEYDPSSDDYGFTDGV